MTAGQDEARAREIVSAIREQWADGQYTMDEDECAAMLEKDLTEARDQGARDALKPNPHLDELTALSQEMGLHDTPSDPHAPGWLAKDVAKASARVAEWSANHPLAPPPALAPLREAEDGILRDLLKDYVSALQFAGWPDDKIKKLPTVKRVRAALSRAQPPTTEDLT